MRGLLLLTALLAACGGGGGGGPRGFYRPGADYSAFYSDLRDCTAEASPRWQFCSGAMCQQMRGEQLKRRNQCMMARGWVITHDEPKFVP